MSSNDYLFGNGMIIRVNERSEIYRIDIGAVSSAGGAPGIDDEDESMAKYAVIFHADMGPRYWEDCFINDKNNDDEDASIPLSNEERWILPIKLDTGEVIGWPAGNKISTFFKVCDDGVYSLIGDDGTVLSKKEDYVPSCLQIDDNGYGDYAHITIDENGMINGWNKTAALQYFESEE